MLRLQDCLSVRRRRKELPRLLALLALQPQHRLLDVGGGTGVYAAMLAGRCEEIVVLEPDRRRLAYGEGRRPQLRFADGTAERLPFRDGHFHRVMAIVSYHHFSDQEGALREMRRVLAPSGRLVMHELEPSRGPGKWIRRFDRAFGGAHAHFLEPADLKVKLEEHGFHDVAVQPASRGYYVTGRR